MKTIHSEVEKQVTFLDERYYWDTESKEYYPSVTTINDVYPKGFGFNQWLKDMGSNAGEVLRRAGEQGTNIHEAIDKLMFGEEITWGTEDNLNYTLEEWKMINKFIEFYTIHKPKVIAHEASLVSSELGCGGTLDLVCELNGVIWLIDYKSSNGIYKTHKIQQAAYKELWNEKKKLKIEKCGILWLKSMTRGPDKREKNIQGKGWKLIEIEDHERLFELFKHNQVIWNEENPNPQPKNLVYPDRLKINKNV